MNEVFTKVLESFQDEKFKEEVEALVNISIPMFAVATQDGSHPLDWTFQHRKYKNLYEVQLQKSLGGDAAEFVQYLQQCQAAYGSDPGFRSLMAALTASEDYEAFLQLMFAAVRENWEPEGGAQPAPGVQVHQVDVAVPEGVSPGMALSIEYLGTVHQVVVPDGFGPGTTLRVNIEVPAG